LKKKSNIYKLLEDDDLVKSHIAEKDGNDINTYILTYKYYTRNTADNFFNIPENTQEDSQIDNSLLNWYKTKNPDFKPLGELPNLKMKEFKTLLVTIAMNVMKLLLEKKYPASKYKNGKNTGIKRINSNNNMSFTYLNKKLTNNKDKIEYDNLLSILTDINNEDELNVSNEESDTYFSYKKITEIYLKFIAYMSGNHKIKKFDLNSDNDEYISDKNILTMNYKCDFYIDYIKKIYKYTPFIIYPTFIQQHELKVFKTMTAPVINFLITYTRVLSHDIYESPCNHIEHDVMFHGTITHLSIYRAIDQEIIFYENNFDKYFLFTTTFIQKYKTYSNEIKRIYNNIISPYFNNLIIKLLKLKLTSESEYKSEIEKNFKLFHEIPYFGVAINIYEETTKFNDYEKYEESIKYVLENILKPRRKK